jgi:UPF0042 nucleotide-binding protein
MSTRIFIVTGLSGAGKTTALKALEDRGCEVIDNIPIALCSELIEHKRGGLALGVDVRTRDFNPEIFLNTLAQLRQRFKIELLFFEASPVSLQKRYRETRRQHPLGCDQSLLNLIDEEKSLLEPLREAADQIFDTTQASPPEIRSHLYQSLGLLDKSFSLFVLSFSFRQGLPVHSDFVFDVRFLKNPYYHSETRFLSGKDQLTQSYLSRSPECQAFCKVLEDFFLNLILPCMQKEGRASLTIAFGCTGGKHRSVYMAERFTELFLKNNYVAQACHRDLS